MNHPQHQYRDYCPDCRVYYNGEHVCMKQDMVNQPPHYNQGGIETIDAIREALGSEGFNAYCIGNVMKYCWRHKHKGGQQDLQKAVWYMRFANGDDPRKS